jgi:hypothetical protein
MYVSVAACAVIVPGRRKSRPGRNRFMGVSPMMLRSLTRDQPDKSLDSIVLGATFDSEHASFG